MKYSIGIDIGGTNVKAGVVDECGRILVKSSIKTGASRPFDEIVGDIAAQCRALAAEAGLTIDDIGAVGVGMPGTVDTATGTVIYSNNIAWQNVPLAAALEAALGKSVKVENDANAAALGEHRFGASRQFGSSVLITLGTGVGGGIILDDKIFSGFRSAGAEIGHMVIVCGGAPCTCGRRGCFEAYASATGLVRMTRAAMQAHPDSLMWQEARDKTLAGAGGRTAFAAAARGDAPAQAVVDDYLEYLAEGIVNIVNVLRPEVILLGGGVSAQGDSLLLPLRKLCYQKTYGGTDYAPFEIRVAVLGNDAGLLGAACL